MNRSVAAVIALLVAALLASVSTVAQSRTGQTTATSVATPSPRELPVPFPVGETLTYDVSWSTILTAGTVVLTVTQKKPSDSSTAYYIVGEGRPTPLLSKFHALYYKMDTLVDSYTLLSQRGSMYSEEGRQHRFRSTRFDRASRKAFIEYRTVTTVKSELVVPPDAQDALSALYVLRTMAFKAGDRLTLPVSDSGKNYTVHVDVAGHDRLKTRLGELGVWTLRSAVHDAMNQPLGRSIGIWLSDDGRRLPLKIQAGLPVGSLVLTLRDARQSPASTPH